MVVRLETNWRDVSRQLQTWRRDQYPFGISKALTETAKFSAARFKQTLPRKFEIRSRRSITGIQVESANKTRYPRDFAKVGTRDPWIARHEDPPSVSRPNGAHRWAIPSRRVQRTATGRTRRPFLPSSLIQKGGFRTSQSGKGSLRIPKSKLRGGRGQEGVATFYWLRSRIRLRARLRMEEEVRATASVRFPRELVRQLDRASRSARR